MYDDDLSPPTPEPLYPSPSPSQSYHRLWEIGVWIALVAIVVILFTVTLVMPGGEEPAGPGGRLELRLQGRYAVGVDALFGTLGDSFAQSLTGPLLEQVRSLAENDAERLLLVPVVAELAGPEQALEEIAKLRQQEDLTDDAGADLEVLRAIYSGSGEAVSEESRQAFLERREWFARLALSHGRAAEDPERRELLADAMGLAALLIAIAGAVATAGAAGLVLLVVAFLVYRHGKLRAAYEPGRDAEEPARRVAYLETVVVFIGATIGASLVAGLFIEATDNPWALGAVLLALPAVLWPLLRGVSWPELRRAYGWHAGTGVWREIAWGLAGYVAGAPLLIAGILVSVLLTVWIEQPPHHPIMDSIAGAGWGGIVLIYVVACVSAPLAEETVFRGGFHHYLRGHLGVVASALVASAVFAAIHPQGVLGIPPLIALATVLALIREWRGSLVGSVAVHAVHNALATTVLLLLFG